MAYVFADEFNGPYGAAPDPSKWTYDLGRWTDNNELETYTDSRTNSYLDGQGHLVIKALATGGRHGGYTSARLLTQGLFSRSHGNFEARMKVDRATGSWPAWWMIGDNYGQVGWPQCGEIDMVEVYGQPGWDADSTVHCAGNNGNDVSKEVIIPGGVGTGWHIYHLRWDGNTGVIQFSKDNQVYLTVGPGDIPGGNWVFGTPGKRGGAMFMILNLAVGGDGGGPVPSNFTSATMLVDYVRVWLSCGPAIDPALPGNCCRPAERPDGGPVVRRPASVLVGRRAAGVEAPERHLPASGAHSGPGGGRTARDPHIQGPGRVG